MWLASNHNDVWEQQHCLVANNDVWCIMMSSELIAGRLQQTWHSRSMCLQKVNMHSMMATSKEGVVVEEGRRVNNAGCWKDGWVTHIL